MVETEKSIIDKSVSRRKFHNLLGWSFIGVFFTGAIGATLRFFFPRVLYEPPTMYTVGFVVEYTIGVSIRFMKDHRVWVVREIDKLYVIEAKCTHLGCTPNWLASEGKYKCPCHGSGYTPDGVNVEGPAPRPMERFKVTIADDGQILVDQSVRFRGERGEWGKPGAFIPT